VSLPALKDWPSWPLGPFSYDSLDAPNGYACMKCGAHGVRLWRDYNCFVEHQTLTCFPCTLEIREVQRGDDPYKIGRPYTPDSHEIKGQVAAVPTEEGDSFWGYTSVPTAGCAWWVSLRPEPAVDWPHEDALRARLAVWKDTHAILVRCREYDDKNRRSWIARTKSLEQLLRDRGIPFDERWRP
jgi:hypothetical protein